MVRQTVGCRQFHDQLAMCQKKASRAHDRRIGAFPNRLVEQPLQLLRTDLLRQDAENSEPEMAARSAQFLPGGAIPLDGRSMIRNALDRGGQLLEELEALSL